MKTRTLFLLLLLTGGVAFSQSNITYDLEEGLTELLDLNQAAWEKVKKVDGYRIQIVSLSGTNSKMMAEKMQTEFNQKFPKITSYVTYFEPNFRLRVGDFRTKLDAYRFYQEINAAYPGAFIIRDKIEYLFR